MLEKREEINTVCLTGQVVEDPVWSYRYREEHFYMTHIRVLRLSGTADILPVTLPGRLLVPPAALHAGDRVVLQGQIRSYNRPTPQGGKLLLTVFVHSFAAAEGPDENRVQLHGVLCRMPVCRVTPLGRVIADLLVAVNRGYRHADYLPAIAWGEGARRAEGWPVGTAVRLQGRFQSREYSKLAEGYRTLRTAYEISASQVTRIDKREEI